MLREIEEEIGLKLKFSEKAFNNCIKIGKFLKNFYCYNTKKGKLYLTVQAFLWLDNNKNFNLKLNESEIY